MIDEDRIMKDGSVLWIGMHVQKTGGDYQFKGQVVAIFSKRSGHTRCVVENDDGMLFIFNPKQLEELRCTSSTSATINGAPTPLPED